MSYMFYGTSAFNQPLSFDTPSVTNMYGMFYLASAFNQTLSFDTSSVTNMNSMFYVRSAREPWPPIFSCSPPRVCLRRLPRRCPTTLPIPVPHAPHPA